MLKWGTTVAAVKPKLQSTRPGCLGYTKCQSLRQIEPRPHQLHLEDLGWYPDGRLCCEILR